MKEELTASLDCVQSDYVLMQAWKKTSSYLRYHCWYADTLDIDYQSLRIQHFISEIQERITTPVLWKPKPLELVFAPKSQKWEIRKKISSWSPVRNQSKNDVLRPLAHVDLKDQIVATAITMCLANRLENYLGDPRISIEKESNLAKVNAYGNRLFCLNDDQMKLRYTWGNSKLYRQFFQDYQKFIERPTAVANSLGKYDDFEVAVIHSDLSKFYDRVRPELLHEKMCKFKEDGDDESFFDLANQLLNWNWREGSELLDYAQEHEIEDDMKSIALPQGLVASGFLANMVLSDFYKAVGNWVGNFLDVNEEKILLKDACFYVDDIRLVVLVRKNMEENDICQQTIEWLQRLLDENAPTLRIEEKKSQAIVMGRDRRILVQQSATARKIQSSVSGVIDPFSGSDLINEIEGFFHTQKSYPFLTEDNQSKDSDLFVGVTDMRDETVARFAAGRYRQTFRSLRPLLEDSEQKSRSLTLTKDQLDRRAKIFSALLIEEWLKNPSHVRLLRIALDIYPSVKFLKRILAALRVSWKNNGSRGFKRQVQIYCLSEIFRAGAIETAKVRDSDYLPDDVNVDDYHEELIKEGTIILENFIYKRTPNSRFPWYLMQQVLLYLLTNNQITGELLEKFRKKRRPWILHYSNFAAFLSNQQIYSSDDHALFFVLASTSLNHDDLVSRLATNNMSSEFLEKVNNIAPHVASLLWEIQKNSADSDLVQKARNLGLVPTDDKENRSIADLAGNLNNPFYQEINLLKLAKFLLDQPMSQFHDVITPWQIQCKFEERKLDLGKVGNFSLSDRHRMEIQFFTAPDWCDNDDERKKYQTGLLLLFAIRGSTAVNKTDSSSSDRLQQCYYSRPISHWEQQRHSAFFGRSAFGEAWIPLSSFIENLMFQLLRWPGAGITFEEKSLGQIQKEVIDRIKLLKSRIGRHSNQVFLELKAPIQNIQGNTNWNFNCRTLRVGIVQSIIPNSQDYFDHKHDLELTGDTQFRKKQRIHLTLLLKGVEQMLKVRGSHLPEEQSDSILDLLIFPELAVHPDDLNTVVVPFIRKFKCMFLGGIVYHQKYKNQNPQLLINSCYWMIPEWTKSSGFQIRQIEQVKKFLAPDEVKLNKSKLTNKKILGGFRPAQWLVEYEWINDPFSHESINLVLSASVCYDATDLELVADLRSYSDIYIVCALNKDIPTFDRMSEMLSYHMYQGVIVVNNGEYGGSSFFMPFKESYRRQVFQLHGQPQATIAFAEIDPMKFLSSKFSNNIHCDLKPKGTWKKPPAGWKKRIGRKISYKKFLRLFWMH